VTKLALPRFTGARVEGEGSAVLVVLQTLDSGHGAEEEESSLKLEVVVLEGDFNTNDDEDWTEVKGTCERRLRKGGERGRR